MTKHITLHETMGKVGVLDELSAVGDSGRKLSQGANEYAAELSPSAPSPSSACPSIRRYGVDELLLRKIYFL